MDITMIHGQNHKGSTYHIGQAFIEKISGPKQVHEFFLPRDLNCFCKGCYLCLENDANCPYYKEKSLLEKAIKEADLLVFTTPTYCMSLSAPLKSFFDLFFTNWMPHKPKAYMFGKQAVIFSTAAGKGTKNALKEVKKNLHHWGISQIDSFGIHVQAMAWSGVSEKKKLKIDKALKKIIRKLKTKEKMKVTLKVKFLFFIMAKMHKAGYSASEAEKLYWQEEGWLEKKRPWK